MAWAPFYPVSTGLGFGNNLERIPHALLFLQEFYDITSFKIEFLGFLKPDY